MDKHIGECGLFVNDEWQDVSSRQYFYNTKIEKWFVGCKYQGCTADVTFTPTNYYGAVIFEDGECDESFQGSFSSASLCSRKISIIRDSGTKSWMIWGRCKYIRGNTCIDVMPYLRSGEISSNDVIECRDALRRILSAGVKHKLQLCDISVECDIVSK